MLLQSKYMVIISLIVLLLTIGCQSSVELEFLDLDSANFTVYYIRGHESPAKDILEALEVNHDRIIKDLQPAKEGKYVLWIYPNLNTFHKAVNMPGAPAWIVGKCMSEDVMAMVSPYSPGLSHSYEGLLQVAVHEFTHCVTARVASEHDAPASIWLWESIALYEAGQERNLSALPYMQTGQFPRFLDITADTQSADIYQLGYSIAHYVIQNWGWEGIHDLIVNTGDVNRALGITEDEFYSGWYEFDRSK